MEYIFDNLINRKGTRSAKWEYMQSGIDPEKLLETENVPGGERIIPMWVADMDFPSPAPVVEALRKRAEHGIFGYTVPGEPYLRSIVDWFSRRHQWNIDPEWICVTFGVIPALNILVRTFTSPGDKVLVQRPVYYPFFSVIERNGCSIENNPLIYRNKRYTMDFTDLAEKVRDPSVKIAILCSPHNPVGRVWSEEELTRFTEICLENGVLVISDEIHGDLVYSGYSFTPLARINNRFSDKSIICTAPSKTFNLAGLQTSDIVISNGDLRKRFKQALQRNGIFGINPFGQTALEAAYNDGEEWLEQVLDYLEGNLHYLKSFVSKKLPGVTLVQPEATFLVWIDFRNLVLEAGDLRKLMLEKAGVHFEEGGIFGPEGDGFERINIACPRSILREGLTRIERTLKKEGYF
jgi:cystathionine beta-lyase